jgi:hypothetical protein
LMIGVAAGALLAGVNIAASQSTMERQPGGASMEQKSGAQQGAQQKGRSGDEMKANSPAGNARAQAPDKAQAQEKGQVQDKAQSQDKVQSQGKAQSQDKAQSQEKAQSQDKMKSTTGQGEQKAQDQKMDTQKGAQSKPDAKSGSSAQSDTKAGSSTSAQGQGSASGKAANLNAEQKTKIRETVLRGGNAPRVSNVNFSLSVGTVVPNNVHFVALPPVLVEIFPEWRGYDYIIVDERIVILEPRTHKIVTILVV